jgi:hypothetical protein
MKFDTGQNICGGYGITSKVDKSVATIDNFVDILICHDKSPLWIIDVVCDEYG